MTDEIFGPILPILTYRTLPEALRFVNARPKPLAFYVFAEDHAVQKDALRGTTSGGACVNDVVAHLSVHGLPFGGVGESGMGAYHGKASFDTFTHMRSTLEKSSRLDVPLRYPPYDDAKKKWLERLM
jgi:aldehyde dehydrogenase (NAD+)